MKVDVKRSPLNRPSVGHRHMSIRPAGFVMSLWVMWWSVVCRADISHTYTYSFTNITSPGHNNFVGDSMFKNVILYYFILILIYTFAFILYIHLGLYYILLFKIQLMTTMTYKWIILHSLAKKMLYTIVWFHTNRIWVPYVSLL